MSARILADTDAERAVLGAILIDPGTLPQVQALISTDDFYSELHAHIYAAMVQLAERSKLDMVALADLLDSRGQLPRSERAYLVGLLSAVPSGLFAEGYAEVVRAHSVKRQLVDLCSKAVQGAYSDTGPEEDLANLRAGLEQLAGAVTADSAVLYGEHSIAEHERILADRALAVASGREWPTFPWEALRRKVRWLRPGEVAVLGAESSVGKTAWAECVAEHMAREGFKVVFFHLELSHTTMLNRRLSRHSGVPITELERGAYPPAAVEANRRIGEWARNVTYVHCPGWTIERITSLAESMSARGQCDVIVLDYLTKVRPSPHTYRMSRNDQLAEQVEAVKSLVERRGMFALVLSQVNRASANETIKTGNALRASGEIEEKANLVMLLDRRLLKSDEVIGGQPYEAGARSPEATLQVDKQTNGPTGSVPLWFDPEHIRFTGAVVERFNE